MQAMQFIRHLLWQQQFNQKAKILEKVTNSYNTV